ncbi:MAG: DUF6496 domain-containing protein [Niabella sp.]
MAKYSKGAAKSVKSAMRKMKQGKLTSGTSGKKVTSKKQAIAIGLSEAREKGAKVPAKKAAAKKSTTAGKSTAAPKKAAAKKAPAKKSQKVPAKKATAKKSTTARKSTAAPKEAAVKKAAAVKSPAKKKKPAASKSSGKKISPRTKTKMQGVTAKTDLAPETGEKVTTEPVTNNDINNEVTPEAESAVFTGSQPQQQWIPEQLNTASHDPFHGNIKPSKAKTTVKPSGKKPLWDNRK